MDLDLEIRKVISDTFDELGLIMRGESNNRMIFPEYRKKNTVRICEQELRFLFIEKLQRVLKEKGLYYSIETPTKDKYKFTDKSKKDFKPCSDKYKGRSANFDLVIFASDKKTRLALIEFKAKNASAHSHAKDFCKLSSKEEGNDTTLRYFIEILEKSDEGTVRNLKEQKIMNNKYVDSTIECPITIACYSLDHHPILLDGNNETFYSLTSLGENA